MKETSQKTKDESKGEDLHQKSPLKVPLSSRSGTHSSIVQRVLSHSEMSSKETQNYLLGQRFLKASQVEKSGTVQIEMKDMPPSELEKANYLDEILLTVDEIDSRIEEHQAVTKALRDETRHELSRLEQLVSSL